MYNKTFITQLGTCVVSITYKNNKKKCEFFVGPNNGQALLGILDTAALNIMNVNIDSIEAEGTWKENCNTNISDAKMSNIKQEIHGAKESCTNTDEDLKSTNNVNGSDKNTNTSTLTNYFLSSPNMEIDKRKSPKLTWNIHNVFDNDFNGIGYFEGTFLLQLKPDSKPYQVPPGCVAYALQKMFKDELDWLQQLDIITPLGVDKTAEWCNIFVLVPKANGKVRLCLEPVRLNQALIRPVHRGPKLNDILPKFNNVKYISIIDTSSRYHNLKWDEKSSYLTTFACLFGRYRYKWLPYELVPVGDMFQYKIDEIFSDMPNVFGIADDILVIGYDNNGTDHDTAVHKVLPRCKRST